MFKKTKNSLFSVMWKDQARTVSDINLENLSSKQNFINFLRNTFKDKFNILNEKGKQKNIQKALNLIEKELDKKIEEQTGREEQKLF